MCVKVLFSSITASQPLEQQQGYGTVARLQSACNADRQPGALHSPVQQHACMYVCVCVCNLMYVCITD